MLHPVLHVHTQYELEKFIYCDCYGWNVCNITNCLRCKVMFDDKQTPMHV